MRMRIVREGEETFNGSVTWHLAEGSLRWADEPLPVKIQIGSWKVVVGRMFDLKREADHTITAAVELFCDFGNLKPEVNVAGVEYSDGSWIQSSVYNVQAAEIIDMELGGNPVWDDLGVIE
jgi:hypothetical protein